MKNSLVCIDANLVIRMLIGGPFFQEATNFLDECRQKGVGLVSPVLFSYEVASAIRRSVHLKRLTPEEGQEAFRQLLAIPVRLSNRPLLLPLAWQIAKEYHFARVYDALYLATAQTYHCDFWTADERLYNSVNTKLAWVKLINHYARSPRE